MSEQDKHSKRCHRIYLAGSWKNQQEIFLIRDILKTQGHEVDCFASEENGRISFNWSKLPDIQDKLPKMDAKDMLEVPRVQEAFREDKKWIDWCDLCLLTLPSGKSSHLEAGYAKGQGKTVVIFGDLKKGDFDVMYGFADAIFRCDELDQMVDFVNSCIRTILTTEKDDVHWITGQELREIYADKFSLDKYDEIRKRPAAKVENVPLCGFFGQIDCCQTPDVRGACTVSEQCVKYYRDTSGKGAETMTSPCNFCRHRQPSLDPEGCFVQAGSTGIIGRFLRWVFGCERFDQK